MRTNYLYIFLAAAVSFTACKKSFLEQLPPSTATTENFYKTADDFKNALNANYGSLQSGGVFGNAYIYGDIPSDNNFPVPSGSVTDQDEFDRFYIKTTNPFVANRWNDSYKAISRSNTILSRIAPIAMSDSLKKRFTAEAQFLRALVYFNLVRSFGDVPLVVTEITNANQAYEYTRDPAASVYAQIEADLKAAEAALPVSYTGADIGRATSGAAKALLGKVLLTQHKYPDAAAKLKEVISSGTYAILDKYADVFDVSKKNNKESVFDVQYKSGGVKEGNPLPNSFAPENSGDAVVKFGGDGNNQPTPDMENAYEAGDTRKSFSMATSYVNASGATVNYYFVKKYFDVPATKNDNGNNFPVIRYADVVLMYAEALNEIGYQGGGEAFTYLNIIRKRAGLAEKTAANLPDQASFRLAIENERRVELAFEGHRWYDLVRTGRAIPVLNSKKAQIRLVADLTSDNLVIPVPQSQIDINKDKIKQNKGY